MQRCELQLSLSAAERIFLAQGTRGEAAYPASPTLFVALLPIVERKL